jgi:hypothetical protein
MPLLESLSVVRDPRAEPSRPEGAADVEIESGLQLHPSQAADSDQRIP